MDEIVSHALPSPHIQLANLLVFLRNHAGDAPFASIDISDHDALLGLVGSIDESALGHLLAWAKKDGLVTLSQDNRMATLTPQAWDITTTPVTPPPKIESVASQDVRKGHCPQCGPDRSADVVASYEKRWDDDDVPIWSIDTYRILRCRGCEEVYIQHEYLFSENETYERNPATGEHEPTISPRITYWPSPAKRERPEWLHQLGDTTLLDLLEEVYGALDSDHRVLAAIGTRTALDRAMVLQGADEPSTFAEKLTSLQKRGIISENEQQLLTTLTDAGNAAAHRGWKPTPEQLKTLLDGVESFLHRTLILDTAVNAIKGHVPPKASRKNA